MDAVAQPPDEQQQHHLDERHDHRAHEDGAEQSPGRQGAQTQALEQPGLAADTTSLMASVVKQAAMTP